VLSSAQQYFSINFVHTKYYIYDLSYLSYLHQSARYTLLGKDIDTRQIQAFYLNISTMSGYSFNKALAFIYEYNGRNKVMYVDPILHVCITLKLDTS